MAKLTEAQQLAQLLKIKNPTPAQLSEISVLQNPLSNPTTGYGVVGGASTGTSTATNLPTGVTKSDAGNIINFSLPGQKTPFTSPVAGLTPSTSTTGPAGETQTTLQNFMQQIADISGDSAQVDQVQTLLKAGGYLKGKYSPGTVDAATKTAWRLLALDSQGTPFSAMTLLYAGANAPLLKQDLADVVTKINTAQENAASVTNSNVTLTDPNKVAQTFETAMESMGMGPPTPDQTQKFVTAFHNTEVSATQNEAQMEKQNMLSGAGSLQTELTTLEQGGIAKYNQMNNGLGVAGPVGVATKAAPNLDAEATAQAQAMNPSQYDATGSTYLYGLLQRMLGGDMTTPTSPQSPSSQTPAGGILTTPLVAPAAP